MEKNNSLPYNPSWINHLTHWIKGLPGSRWGYYIGLGLLLIMIQHAIFWIDGALSVGKFHPVNLFLTAAIPFIMGIIAYFDGRAHAAFESIGPSLTIDENDHRKFLYQLTHLPALKSVLASFLALIFLFTSELIGGEAYHIEAFENYAVSTAVGRSTYVICWWFFGVFIYHTIHQLELIYRIYTHHTLIDLFRMKPLYGFSNLTALTAGSLILLPYGFLFINPDVNLSDPVVLSSYVIFSSIALITFFLPQLGIHRLQQDEKEHLLIEINQRYKATMDEVHKRVDSGNFDGASSLVSALQALTNERKTIIGISTWPWQPETLRWLFTAMVLPLLMWIAQYFLGQLLN